MVAVGLGGTVGEMRTAGVALDGGVGEGSGAGVAPGVGVGDGVTVGVKLGVIAGLPDRTGVPAAVSRPAWRQAPRNEASTVSPPRPAALRRKSRRLMRRLATGTSMVGFTSWPAGVPLPAGQRILAKIAKYCWNVKPEQDHKKAAPRQLAVGPPFYTNSLTLHNVCPQGDSNPCLHLERVMSWSSRRWGRANQCILP